MLQERVDALVNTVNCIGIMGKGIALQFKLAFPDNFNLYKKACDLGEVQIGKMFVSHTQDMFGPKYIINFPTKKHWKEKSKYEYIEKGMDDLIHVIEDLNIKSIAIPPLGCGAGGLEWEKVRSIIEKKLARLNIQVSLFAPSRAPVPEKMKIRTKIPNMTPGRASLIGLLKAYKQVGYAISQLEIQKLMYFLQETGEPLRLAYEKANYGPYANNLHHVLQAIEDHYISGYGDRTISTSIHLKEEGIQKAEDYLNRHEETRKRLDKVINLIRGFETPYGLELLATVHWIIKKNGIEDDSGLIQEIQNWNPRKKQLFSFVHIKMAKKKLHQSQFI